LTQNQQQREKKQKFQPDLFQEKLLPYLGRVEIDQVGEDYLCLFDPESRNVLYLVWPFEESDRASILFWRFLNADDNSVYFDTPRDMEEFVLNTFALYKFEGRTLPFNRFLEETKTCETASHFRNSYRL